MGSRKGHLAPRVTTIYPHIPPATGWQVYGIQRTLFQLTRLAQGKATWPQIQIQMGSKKFIDIQRTLVKLTRWAQGKSTWPQIQIQMGLKKFKGIQRTLVQLTRQAQGKAT